MKRIDILWASSFGFNKQGEINSFGKVSNMYIDSIRKYTNFSVSVIDFMKHSLDSTINQVITNNPKYFIVLYVDYQLKKLSDYLKKVRHKWDGNFIPYVPIEFLNLNNFKNNLEYECNFYLTMSHFGKKILNKNIDNIDVRVLEHIVEGYNEYSLLEKNICKKKLYSVKNQNKFIIGVVAANNSRKRLDLSIESFNLFNTYNPNSLLVIKTTKGNIYECKEPSFINLHDYADNNNIIIIDDFINEKQLCDLYNSFDLMINTTDAEGFGLTVFEGALCGTLSILPYHSSFTSLLPNYEDYDIPPYCVDYLEIPYEYARTTLNYTNQSRGLYKHYILYGECNKLSVIKFNQSFLKDKNVKTYVISKYVFSNDNHKCIEDIIQHINYNKIKKFQIAVTSDIKSLRYVIKLYSRILHNFTCFNIVCISNESLERYVGEDCYNVGIVKPYDMFIKMKFYYENNKKKKYDAEILKKHTINRFSKKNICKQLENYLEHTNHIN